MAPETVVLEADVVLQHDNGTFYFAARKGQTVSAEQAAAWGVLDAPEPEPEPEVEFTEDEDFDDDDDDDDDEDED